MEKTLEIRHMTWSEYEKYMDEVEAEKPEFDTKGNVPGKSAKESARLLDKYRRKAAKWMMDNIYPDFQIDWFTPHEVIAIYAATMSCTKSIRESEIKNLKSSLIGSVKEPSTAEAAQEPTLKQENL